LVAIQEARGERLEARGRSEPGNSQRQGVRGDGETGRDKQVVSLVDPGGAHPGGVPGGRVGPPSFFLLGVIL
jgi:hypothetical protein